MKKFLLLLAVTAACCLAGDKAGSQTSDFKTLVLSGTADVLIDSTLTSTYMKGKRLYINGIYWWYDNAANTNQIFVEVVRGIASVATQGSGRQFKYSEALTSNGIKGTSMPMNLTTDADSTLYFVINATGSDSLYMAVNYKFESK